MKPQTPSPVTAIHNRAYSRNITPNTFTLCIANFRVQVVGDNEAVFDRLRTTYADFLAANDVQPLVTIALTVTAGVQFLEQKRGSTWETQVKLADGQMQYTSYFERGEVDFEKGLGRVEIAPQASMENFLRVIYAVLCLQHGGLLLHAAGVIRNGEGIVFFGPSGAGKTTTAGIAAQSARVLSDDLVIIRPHNGQYKLHGVPFRGAMQEVQNPNVSAPLKAVFRLQQGVSHAIQPYTTLKAASELVAAAPFVVQEPRLGRKLIDVCTRLAQSVPVAQLNFRRDDGFWKEIDGYFETIPATPRPDSRSAD